MNGNFVADAFVRQDFYLMELTDPANGLSHQSHTANGVSVGGSVAYRFVLPASWYIEPSGGGSWSLVQVGRIDTPGVPSNLFASGIANIGSVQVNDIESLLGRVSLRTGFTTKVGSTTVSPFAIGTVFHEFANDVTSVSRGGGPTTTPCIPPLCPTPGINTFFNQLLNTSTSRVGTFGQVGLGTAAAFADPRWSAFARADYRFGENVDGYSLNGGVRFQW
jgi:outer membrane autotransporter protein